MMMHTLESLKTFFKKKKLKATPQRLFIAQEILKGREHLSSDEIFERVQVQLAGVSRATVYNTLHTLAEQGVIKELHVNPEKVLYDANPEPHHHFVCENTGEIFDIHNEWIGKVTMNKIKKQFDVRDFSITFRGYRKS